MKLQNTIAGFGGSILSANLEDRFRVAAEMLIAGVAFQTSGTRWSVYSHNGEHIGELSTFIVNETTRALKTLGLKGVSVTRVNEGEEQSITFGFECHQFIDAEEMDQIIARRERKFSTIH